MRFPAYLIMIAGFSGCGSSIGAFDSLPAGPDVNSLEWPRLVDTPALPEQLNIQTGERVIERLDRQGNAIDARRQRADAVSPVSEQLVTRATASRTRSAVALSPSVNDTSLLERAARSRESTQVTSAQFDESDLLARAARQRARNAESVISIDESNLLARAAQQRVRNADVGLSVDEGNLLARATRQQERTATAALPNDDAGLRARSVIAQNKAGSVVSTPLPVKAPTPRPPQPLRPLDTPVVSSSFEERARRARLRAAGAGN